MHAIILVQVTSLAHKISIFNVNRFSTLFSGFHQWLMSQKWCGDLRVTMKTKRKHNISLGMRVAINSYKRVPSNISLGMRVAIHINVYLATELEA